MAAPKNRPNKPVVSLTLDEELIEKIDKYQHENMMRSRSQATSQLLNFAFDMLKAEDIDEEIDIDPLEEAQFLLSTLNDLITKIKKERE